MKSRFVNWNVYTHKLIQTKSGCCSVQQPLSENLHNQMIVTGYFDYIEDLIERENVFTMEEFEKSVNAFLEFRQYKILKDNGRISHKQAMDKANAEYEVFNKTQPIESDFDKAVKKMIEEQK